MKTIFKYQLSLLDSQTIELPEFAQPLSVQMQYGEPQLWALVESTNPLRSWHVLMYGTGHEVGEMPNGHVFLGTVHWGKLVFHYFGYPKPVA